jgi:hypothetical protein
LNGGFSTNVGPLRGLPVTSKDKIETFFWTRAIFYKNKSATKVLQSFKY